MRASCSAGNTVLPDLRQADRCRGSYRAARTVDGAVLQGPCPASVGVSIAARAFGPAAVVCGPVAVDFSPATVAGGTSTVACGPATVACGTSTAAARALALGLLVCVSALAAPAVRAADLAPPAVGITHRAPPAIGITAYAVSARASRADVNGVWAGTMAGQFAIATRRPVCDATGRPGSGAI